MDGTESDVGGAAFDGPSMRRQPVYWAVMGLASCEADGCAVPGRSSQVAQ